MSGVGENGDKEYVQCRVERQNPGTDWNNCWRLARIPGLGPNNVSFLFKLLHQTLPTQERVGRVKPNHSSSCKMLECQGNTEETLLHGLIECQGNDGVGQQLLAGLRNVIPDLQGDSMLRQELALEEDLECHVTFVPYTVLQSVRNLRQRQLGGRVKSTKLGVN